MTAIPNALRDVWLVYDGQCPVCTAYCRVVRLQDAGNALHLIDARQGGGLMDEITRAGLDIDQGMVLKVDDTLYYGADAIRVLTLMSGRVGWLNRLNAALFATPGRAGVAYALGKALRNVVLKVMGIRYIDNLGQAARTGTPAP